MQSGRGEGNRNRREGSMEEGNGEVCTSKTLAALESSIFLTLKRVRVRMTVALPSSLLESRLPRLFSDSMPHISFSLLASSFWPEIPTKSVFIGRQGSRLQLPDVEWKLPEMWVLLPEQWPGDVVGLEMKCVYVSGEIGAARYQWSKLVATVLGVGTFILTMPDTSRETACVGYVQEPKVTLLLWVTSKHGSPALFEGVCKPFNPGDGLLCGEAISLRPTYMSQSGLPCTMSETSIPLQLPSPHWGPLCIDHAPREPKGLLPQTLAQSRWCPLCTDPIVVVPERPEPESTYIAYFWAFPAYRIWPVLPLPYKSWVLPPGEVPLLEFVSVVILSPVK